MRAAAAARTPILEGRTNEPPPPPSCTSLDLDHCATRTVFSQSIESKSQSSDKQSSSPPTIPPTLSDLERGVHVGSADVERTDPSLECVSGAGHKNTKHNSKKKKKKKKKSGAARRQRKKDNSLAASAAQDAAEAECNAVDLAEVILEEAK